MQGLELVEHLPRARDSLVAHPRGDGLLPVWVERDPGGATVEPFLRLGEHARARDLLLAHDYPVVAQAKVPEAPHANLFRDPVPDHPLARDDRELSLELVTELAQLLHVPLAQGHHGTRLGAHDRFQPGREAEHRGFAEEGTFS